MGTKIANSLGIMANFSKKNPKAEVNVQNQSQAGGEYISSDASLSFRGRFIPKESFRFKKTYTPKPISEIEKEIKDYNSGAKLLNLLNIDEKRDFIRDLTYLDTKENNYPLSLDKSPEYPILKELVESLGIKTTPLSLEETKNLNENLFKLPDILKNIDFGEYTRQTGHKLLTLKFPTSDFMHQAEEITSNLSKEEQEKVYSYFGFEINDAENKFGEITKTVMGYIKDSDKDYKTSGIEDQKTIDALEQLRPLVIRYNSQENEIISENQELTVAMNNIIKFIPELRGTIAKEQHKTHDFTVDTHSLSVLKAIVENSEFDKLNESDKKIMILAGLMHDITKTENVVDKNHPNESGFDTFYISERFNLTREEHEKLYDLINNHDWSERANTKDVIKRAEIIHEVANNLKKDNTFDLSIIFAKADLIGVAANRYFYIMYGSDVDRLGALIRDEIDNINSQS